MKKALTSLTFLLLLNVLAHAQNPEIFLKAVEAEFQFADMSQDASGNTYIVGRNGGSTTVKKYDSAGLMVREQTFTAISSPVAADVGSDGYLYIAGGQNIKRLSTSDLSIDSGVFNLSTASLSDMSIRDIVYNSFNDKVVIGVQNPETRWARVITVNSDLSGTGLVVPILELGVSGGGGVTVRGMSVDDSGNVYMVGESCDSVSAGYDANRGYIVKHAPDGTYKVVTLSGINDAFEVLYTNGWVYTLGLNASNTDRVTVMRIDTTLGGTATSLANTAFDNFFYVKNADYSGLENDSDGKKEKFSLSADALDNIFVSGYTVNGTTEFYLADDTKVHTIASTSEAAYILKLNSSFEYTWIKTPIQSPFSTLGSIMRIAWDGVNRRLWWAGSFSGDYGISMQDGSDASSLRTLSQDNVTQGFVAVLEEDGAFTQIVDFTLLTDWGEDRVTLNGKKFGSKGATFKVILNSEITVQTPREIYRWTNGNGTTVETDNVEANQNVIDNADTQYSFLNFSVNSVVEASSATSYSFTLAESTIVQLEWLVSYALVVDSDFANTASRATIPGGGLFVEPLTSPAAGLPSPAVGKHWIEKDTPLSLTINGYENDLSAEGGLKIRYVPYAYSATGSFAQQVAASGAFDTIAAVQQLDEFTMSGPASVTYAWKLQYGVEIRATDPSADSQMLVEYVRDFDGPGDQASEEGSGVHWYDDGTTVRIAAPLTLDFQSGPQSIKGWLGGDNYIFSPGEGSFSDSLTDLFTTEQEDNGFLIFDYNGSPYAGREVKLERPARVIWSYGDKVIFKTVAVTDYISFTAAEIASYGLKVGQEPTLDAPEIDPTAGTGDIPTTDDYIWDPVAKKFFPVRVVEMDLKWATDSGNPAPVKLTVVWPQADYKHIANTPGVSLIPHPPAGQPDDLIFQSIAYTNAAGGVNDDEEFTATQPGRSVLEFNRITSPGRGGVAQSVVEIKIVQTSLWNTNLGSPVPATIGQKITSLADLAGLGTGYVFFEKASYNPYIYDSSRFIGEALWHASVPPGPIIPVNRLPLVSPQAKNEFVVVWYDNPLLNDHMLWPYTAVRYRSAWPTSETDGLGRILMSSGFGSESVAVNGSDQSIIYGEAPTTFDPARFEQVSIYNQPDRNAAGYNPNEEHALMAPSLRYASVAPRPLAAYAMRENDLNISSGSGFTSQPFVLVQYLDKSVNEFKMKVYNVARQDVVNYPNGFNVAMKAGEPVIPFYPIGVVSGATLCESSYAKEGDATQLTFWKDHKNTAWAVSGDGAFSEYFYYPLSPDFAWPDGTKSVGDCVAWLPNSGTDKNRTAFGINYDLPTQTPLAQGVAYTTAWPVDVPIMKVGETLTFAGGEYAADNPGVDGLPGVLAWGAGEVIYDDLNPDMREGSTNQDGKTFENYTCRLISALEERRVDLIIADFPDELKPATGRTDVDGTIYKFADLSSSLKKRIFYDPLTGELGIKGFINDKDIGATTLTAAPPAVYVLEPNILTEAEYKELKGTDPDSPFVDISGNTKWTTAVDKLYTLSRNPNQLSSTRRTAGGGYTAGLQVRDSNIAEAEAYQALGPGLALVANPGFLDPNDSTLPDVSYVTLAENNDPNLGGSPVTLHIIKIDRRERYRGAIKIVLSDNVFDENIILRHTGDFGANADDLVFDWWYRVEDGTEALPPDQIPAGTTNPWKLFADPSGKKGKDFYQLKLKGNPQAPELLLADSLWFVRYRHKDEAPNNPITWQRTPKIPFEWAGAGNSTPNDLDGDGIPNYQAQLAQGWVKRVLDAVNPYEARIRDFTGDAPATYASMIRQFGQRYEGPVALNPDKNVIENVGLIELYSTVLDRARDLSIDLSTPVSTPGITNALQLASTRLADFYMLLGNEAYSDAQDPMIGFPTEDSEYGSLATTVFTFQNQLSSKMDEELGLLRGVYDYKARPVYNRLFWNFTKGEGEAAYAFSYNISDVTLDGFIDEDDAMVLYPQGHGDAWGHYLTAIRSQYELLAHPYFNWVSRSELYSLQDIVFDVDFLDERKFAQVAAAKAKTGAEIVQLTYRDRYVADPESQWQGYTDTDSKRAWGVEGWARRAGQGAYFDWVTANALIPSEHPNSSYTGIKKVDRTTVKDIAVISANMNTIQQVYEDANDGYNPLGIAGNTVPFDIDPSLMEDGSTHFEQVYERAVAALVNAVYIFDRANYAENMLRDVEDNEIDFRRTVFEEDKGFRNELIEIFGTPYAGTIGSGKAYPAGYQGPDTSLYMYVDHQIREISTATVPGVPAGFISDIGTDGPVLVSNDVDGLRATYASSFSSNNPSDWFSSFGSVNYIQTEADGITFDITDDAATGTARVPLTNIDLPIRASGYTFEAPYGVDGGEDWGERQSPGLLQLHIAKMIQQEAELAKSIAAWDAMQGEMVRNMRLVNARISRDEDIRALLAGKIANKTVLGAAIIAQNAASVIMNEVGDSVAKIAIAAPEFIPKNLPTGGLAISPGDAAAPARGAINLAGSITSSGLETSAVVLGITAASTELLKDLIDEGLDYEIDKNDRLYDLKEALVELENSVGDEGILRIEVYREQEALRELSQEYRALLLRGARLIDSREAYNKRVAELVQRNRYHDMSFRVARNTTLQRYHEAFDLAARYTYLAAKAYDYETNLHPDDAGSAQGMLADIIGERSLGQVPYGVPTSGNGGLAEHLVRMKANFDVLKGQLGLNNPQTETGRFSLRQELFRIAPDGNSDVAWQDELEAAKVDNLWDLPEFRRYCRPFAAFDPNVREPGIVIDFSSYIASRKNFFGKNLAGGDNAYDPTNFATKVFSVGTWFEGYLSSGFGTGTAELSQTPRIYLIPVGSDVMTYPSDDNLGVRMWNVLDQKIPVPYPVLETNLDDNAWRPLDTLGGTEGDLRKFSSFRAYHDSGYFDESEMTFDTRLVGRSVWNTRWLLIIPGSTLNADPDAGLETFIQNISDIKLFFQTYGYSGN